MRTVSEEKVQEIILLYGRKLKPETSAIAMGIRIALINTGLVTEEELEHIEKVAGGYEKRQNHDKHVHRE